MEPFPLHPKTASSPAENEHGTDSGTAALAELHTRLVDTISGFDKVVEKAEPGFRTIAEDFRTMHQRHSRAIGEMLARDGHDPSRDGSVFGAMNRGLVEMRSWFDTIDVNIMDALVQGEKHVLEGYEQAIVATKDAEQRNSLEAMRDTQLAMMDRHCTPS
ncbi:MAG: DUF2383 domain-containing protein [Pararhodobacter sp.]|nr:DUF2383 domain-containing protein [Pararhodobacter sp.]